VKTTIVLSEAEWAPIYNKLAALYMDRPSVILIRSKMREELGFTVRRHAEWKTAHNGRWDRDDTIRLDFYNEEALTWFRLSFL
jgi:hypothetical protein